MIEGSVVDEVSGSAYPDPLSLNYLNFNWGENLPKKDIMRDNKIIFFWKEAEMCYGEAAWDDIVLTLNGVSHRNFLQVGDVIYFPTSADIKKSFKKER